jgi:nicotinate-nucleotide adenylyltransferase
MWIAEAALESLQLDELRWIPAAQSPLKPSGPVASNEDRLQMLHLAVSGREKFVVDDRELRRGEVSYTVDTMAELRKEFPDAHWVLIIGSDSLASFQKWHQPKELLEMTSLAVVQRGGEPEIDFQAIHGLTSETRIADMRKQVIQMPVIEISSTEIRERIQSGKSIRYRVPRPVEAMIDTQNIYSSEAQ